MIAVEVFSRPTDLHVVQPPHHVPKTIVQEAKEDFGVFLYLQDLHLLYLDPMLPAVQLEGLYFWRHPGVDVVSTKNWAFCIN